MDMEINKNKVYTFSTEIAGANAAQCFLDKNSPLTNVTLCTLRTRRASATMRSLQGKQIANNANFDAAFLVLKIKQTETVKIPLWHIEQASLQSPATGYPIFLSDVDFAQSFVEVQQGVTLDTGNVFELTATYYEPKK